MLVLVEGWAEGVSSRRFEGLFEVRKDGGGGGGSGGVGVGTTRRRGASGGVRAVEYLAAKGVFFTKVAGLGKRVPSSPVRYGEGVVRQATKVSSLRTGSLTAVCEPCYARLKLYRPSTYVNFALSLRDSSPPFVSMPEPTLSLSVDSCGSGVSVDLSQWQNDLCSVWETYCVGRSRERSSTPSSSGVPSAKRSSMVSAAWGTLWYGLNACACACASVNKQGAQAS